MKKVIPIINDEYSVIVCWGEEAYIRKILKKYGYKDDNIFGTDAGATYHDSLKDPVIALKGYPVSPEEVGVLAHEATHAVKFIFDEIGEKSIDEVFAHSVGAIVREVLSLKGTK